MRKTAACLTYLASFCAIAVPLEAWQQEAQVKPLISVTSTAKVTAKADLAIVFMTIRSSAPLAADALEQNKKKVQDVQARLAELGYKDGQVKWSGNRFAPAGDRMYYPGGQRPTGFDVYNNLYVHLEGADLQDVNQLNARVSSLLDELSKLGAAPSAMPISRISMGGTSVVAFAVKDPAPYEKQAYQEAMEQARPVAESIAARMKVKITGVESVQSSAGSRAMMAGPVDPLEEIPYEYISSSLEEVPIRVRLDVRYAYK